MEKVHLNELLAETSIVTRSSDKNPLVTGIVYDSRKATTGSVFVALSGASVDGHDFIPDAIERGAAVVVREAGRGSNRNGSASSVAGVVFVDVEDTRRALSTLAARRYEHPSREMTTIGVTGTDGKSTTVFIIHQLLEAVGIASGFLSTPLLKIADDVVKNPFRNSTPESLEIQRILREMVSSRRTHAVIEATSHGLSSRTSRLADVSFDCGVFTNLSHEHLEFHGSFEQYRNDKGNLFRALDESEDAVGIVNLDDDSAPFFSAVSSRPVYTYSIARSDADLFATGISLAIDGTAFTLQSGEETYQVRSPLPGEYNVSNLLAALLVVVKSCGVPVDEVLRGVPSLEPQPGRMEQIGTVRGATVIVDYAHTPGAFQKLLPDLRRWTDGKLVIVFGSAGERDVEKRALQGEVADRYADVVVLTDEDPRGEPPKAILEQIAAAMPEHHRGSNLFLIPDRREAIGHALSLLRPGDTLALLGKGHESGIIYREHTLQWDEAAVARSLIGELS